ncbi:glycine--tRNA ligase-like [Panonychus citri]|uniref:glycine--tRNA ligase-like n=1 Tax=Panonychus citri TaxID=50023 RepID=UPI0023077538|nr:glycine--tRNA ligase-like [Panonychus citri]
MIFTLTRNLVNVGLDGIFCLREQFIKSFHCSTYLLKKLPPNWHQDRLIAHRRSILKKMANTDKSIETILQPLRDSVKEQGDLVRKLKEEKANDIDIKKAVNELKARKKILEDKELSLAPVDIIFQRTRLEDLLKRRFFVDISFSIYGGVSGQYDFGPMGCAMKHNILNLWRNHFVIEDNLLEVDCTILTPEPVLKASGHVERFADLMVKDEKTGECYRLDHLIKAQLEKIMEDKALDPSVKNECEEIIARLDGFSKDEMANVLKKFNMKAPLTGNDLTEPIEFNLMFSTQIGPSGHIKGFLRPETAQGIFVNFKRLLEFNQGKLPFGAAQIGNAFRNEISPRSGLIRVREFTMAEIEYFVDPGNKDHPRFESIADLKLPLFSACNQMDGKPLEEVSLRDAVANKIIANETLAYFMARIYQFLLKVGVNRGKVRFRQHMGNEMAHYACDCWDAECLTSYGWVECVGCADRSCYDLTQHSKATGVKLVAEKNLTEPMTVDVVECVPNRAMIGKNYKADAKILLDGLSSLSIDDVNNLEKKIGSGENYQLALGEKSFDISKEMVTVRRYAKKVHVQEITPSVIEPSFGIGRIMYSVFEHSFKVREEDEQRVYLTLAPIIAPTKCSVLPLSGKSDFVPFVQKIATHLKELAVSHKIDDSSVSIGKRYSRADEIAIPFGITIDFDTLKEPHTVTLRERDTMSQIRLPVDEAAPLVRDLCSGAKSWDDVVKVYPQFEQQETTTKD